MFKNVLQWSFDINGMGFHLFLSPDSPLGAVKEVAMQIIKHCGQMEDQMNAQKVSEEEAKVLEDAKALEQPKADSVQEQTTQE